MKIMIINGSPRKNGATAYILHRIEEVLSSMGVEVIFYNLIEQKMALCNGCFSVQRITIKMDCQPTTSTALPKSGISFF